MFLPVDGAKLHAVVDARANADERLTPEELATLGALDVVLGTLMLKGELEDALELMRRMWHSHRAVGGTKAAP